MKHNLQNVPSESEEMSFVSGDYGSIKLTSYNEKKCDIFLTCNHETELKEKIHANSHCHSYH